MSLLPVSVRRSFTYRLVFTLSGVGAILLMFFLSLSMGSISFSLHEVIDLLFFPADVSETRRIILLEFRFPQALTAMLAGAGLAVGGLQMQALFRNPLADPSLLGVSSGASLGVALLTLAAGRIGGVSLFSAGWAGELSLTLAAFAGSAGILLLILAFSSRLKSLTRLLVFGIMIGYLSYSLVGFLKFYSRSDDLQRFVVWGLGSFSDVSMSRIPVFALATLLGLLLAFLLVKPLNLLVLGEESARNLGLRVAPARWAIIFVSGFLTAVVTAYCGPIGFIGLAVPHLSRSAFSTADHFVLVPLSAMLGSALSLACLLVIRLPIFGGALPVNAVTSLVGAPVVMYVLLKSRQWK